MWGQLRDYGVATLRHWWAAVLGIFGGLVGLATALFPSFNVPPLVWVTVVIAGLGVAQFLAYRDLRTRLDETTGLSSSEMSAKQIRRAEREEQALLELGGLVGEFEQWLDSSYRSWESFQDVSWDKAGGLIRKEVSNLRERWNLDFSTRIHERTIQVAVSEVLTQGETCLAHFRTSSPEEIPPHRFTPAPFVRDVGRLLMLVGELRDEIRKRL